MVSKLLNLNLRAARERINVKGPAWVSAEALNVSPDLLDAPLAKPARRAMAIGIDLLLIAMLSGASNIWLIAALVLMGLQFRKKQATTTSRQRKWVLWGLCAVFVWLGLQHGKDFWEDRQYDDDRPAASAASKAKRRQQTDTRTRIAAEALKREFDRQKNADDGRSPEEREAARGLAIANVVRAATAAASAQGGAAPAPAASETEPAGSAESELAEAEARITKLEQELEDARKPKAFHWQAEAKRWLDGLGVGFGWAIVYFSLVPAWLQGQTLGKKLMGLRVVELTGKPLNVMSCFSRYGGYAAGMATGMMGFVQVLWDVNRQAIQDKIAHTVVIDLRAPRRGQAQVDAARASPSPAVDQETTPAGSSSKQG
jgi:uncharacterized RDD family membrane protein YckC